jgi:lipopolysaccharide export system protein LptA
MLKGFFRIALVLLLLLPSTGWTNNQLELNAPGGGDMDLGKNVMKYYASGGKPVVARWDENELEAGYLEYNRAQEIIKSRNDVKLTQFKPVLRILKSQELILNLTKEYYTASREVLFDYDKETRLAGEQLEWDSPNNRILLSGKPEITYKDWKITGTTVEALTKKGLFTITGPVSAVNPEITIKAGKLTFDRESEVYILEDFPVLTKGKNELTATKLVYNLKTKNVAAEGAVKSKLIKEKE